jgi:hypothetical protein
MVNADSTQHHRMRLQETEMTDFPDHHRFLLPGGFRFLFIDQPAVSMPIHWRLSN